MDDYIDRQAAIAFIDAGHLVNPNEPRWSDNDVVNFLRKRPSADVEPVRRGRWMAAPREEWQTFDECTCSACGVVEYFNIGWKKFNYCPNCGARMEAQDEKN